MARSNVNLMIISILVITASLSSPCHGLSLDGLTIGNVDIYGVARCDLNGDTNAPPISNGTVILRCGGLISNLAETVTDPGGFFTIFLSFLQTVLFSPSTCDMRVYLPTGDCSIRAPDGVLTAAFTLLSVAVTNNTNVAYYALGPFTDGIF